jgi:HK97 family phage prohead protease
MKTTEYQGASSAPVEYTPATVTRTASGLYTAGPMRLQGYAAVFDQRTDLGPFFELIKPGAFDGANLADVRFMINHTGLPLGRTTARTLALGIDGTGLHYTVNLPDTETARELYAAVHRGDVTGSSFGFTIKTEAWDTRQALRSILEIGQVFEISAVAFPAYEGTRVAVV